MDNQEIQPKNENKNAPLRSVHTSNFAEILSRLNISLVVSTYQAGKLITVRPEKGVLNTHFLMFHKPMGVAFDAGRLAVGTNSHIWEFRNMQAVTKRLDETGKYDACFLPRNIHITGNIDIHEMAWTKEELWFVNTRFSCLCTLDVAHSFVPRWRPKFISNLGLGDRCHLNGLGMVESRPKYVTALGETDSAGGWRQNKVNGGILIDVETNEILKKGLSMPHSPRWYAGKLWVLESGKGSLATLDLKTGNIETVATLPGFTRGISFCGKLAFIGLSQVRETAVFSGIPITETIKERTCGVWVINIETGETVAFLRFEEAVQEIFAVEILPGIKFPEIINNDEKLISTVYALPDEALAEVGKPAS